MTTRMLLALWSAAATLAVSPALARDLTIVTFGGALQNAQREVYFRPFAEAAGIPVAADIWDGGIGVLRAKAGLADDPWDVVEVAGEDLLAGCDAGLFEKLDWSAIGGRDHYLPQGVGDCGVGAAMYSFVLAWDRDKFPGTPTWADFWDVAKYPGKRGLRRGPKMNLEIALMADGVAPGDVYKLLRTDDGVDRAFRKLDQLKPYIAWWQAGGQAPEIIGSGEVLFSTAPNVHVASANRRENRNFGIQWAGSLTAVDSWAIVKGSPNAADALKFLAFAGDPAVEAKLAPMVPYGGLAKDATDGLPPDLLAASPANPANLAVSLPIDDQFWHENADRLSQRYDEWLAR